MDIPHDFAPDLWRLMLTNAPFMVAVLDTSLRFQAVSVSFAQCAQHDVADIIGQSVQTIVTANHLALAQPALEQALLGQEQTFDCAMQSGEAERVLRMYVYPRHDAHGAVCGLLMLGVDAVHPNDLVQQRVRIKTLLQQVAEQSETIQTINLRLIKSQTVMAERARQSMEIQQQLRKESEQSTATKGKFLADAVHDLRQPVQALSNVIKPLRDLLGAHESDQVRSLLTMAESATALLTQQLSGVLDLSRLELGQIEAAVAWTGLDTFIADLSLQFAATANEVGVSWQVWPPRPQKIDLHTDRQLLLRVMSNLISNSLKYRDKHRPSGPWIRLEVQHDAEAGRVMLRVADNGIGISEDDMADGRLFLPFYQGKRLDPTVEGGVGLGLSIVKASVQVLPGHQLDIRSQLDVGTTVTVSLPCRQSQPATNMTTLASPLQFSHGELDGVHLILVEDDVLVRKTTTILLNAWGAKVSAAASLNELMTLLAQWSGPPPDVLLTDYRLPMKTTATDVMVCIARQWSAVPCIVVSGDASTDIAIPGGIVRCQRLYKPVMPADLLLTITELMR